MVIICIEGSKTGFKSEIQPAVHAHIYKNTIIIRLMSRNSNSILKAILEFNTTMLLFPCCKTILYQELELGASAKNHLAQLIKGVAENHFFKCVCSFFPALHICFCFSSMMQIEWFQSRIFEKSSILSVNFGIKALEKCVKKTYTILFD